MLLAHTAEEPEAKKEFIQDLTKAIGLRCVDQLVEPSVSLLKSLLNANCIEVLNCNFE